VIKTIIGSSVRQALDSHDLVTFRQSREELLRSLLTIVMIILGSPSVKQQSSREDCTILGIREPRPISIVARK
jgi:hypothetical protein